MCFLFIILYQSIIRCPIRSVIDSRQDMAGTGIDLVLVRNPWGERWWIVQRYVLGWAQPIHMTHLSGGIQSSHFSQFLQLIPLALLFVFSS